MSLLIKRFVFTIVVMVFLILLHTSPSFSQDASPSPSPTPSVSVEIGPTFDKDFESQKQPWYDCLFASFGSRFPFDFVGYDFDISESGDCPTLEIFDSTHSACFIVDTYQNIRPAIIGGLMIYGIFHL